MSAMPGPEAMEFYNSRYFVINMNLLKFMGLWPYQNKLAKVVIRIFFSIVIISFLIPQIIGTFVWRKFVPRLIQCIGTCFYGLGIAAKFYSMLITEKKLKLMYQAMVENWKMLDNQAELNILAKHSEIGRLLTIGYLAYMFGAMLLFISLPILPRFINMYKPIFNGTITEMTILEGEYVVDKQEYYYYIYLIEIFLVLTTVPLFTTIDSTYAVCVQQCAGLLSVVELRLKLSTRHSKKFMNKDKAYGAIVKSVDLHEKVLNYGQILESSYSTSFIFVLGFNTSILSTSSVLILFNLDNPVVLLRYAFLIIGLMIHMFYLSWPGQKVINASNAVFYATYDNQWYECSLKSQQMLKFIMRRAIEPLYLTAGGIYIMNFENFEMLVKTAMSYITVLASFQ